jgi:acyl-CoA synthetase (AMP-forming)/AMP-acid ligase II
MTSADRMQIMTPPSHILGLLNIATAFDAGAWIRLHPRFDVEAMLRHIESDRITIEMAVAPIALALAAHPRLESYDLSSMRYVMWCATPVTTSVADEITRRVGVSWVTAYGASELPVISCNSLDGAQLDTVGRAVPGVEIRIASLESGRPVSPGEVGDVGWLDDAGWLRITDRLASYKRPSRVVFVPEIPRLPSGKVLRRVLKERLWTSA